MSEFPRVVGVTRGRDTANGMKRTIGADLQVIGATIVANVRVSSDGPMFFDDSPVSAFMYREPVIADESTLIMSWPDDFASEWRRAGFRVG